MGIPYNRDTGGQLKPNTRSDLWQYELMAKARLMKTEPANDDYH